MSEEEVLFKPNLSNGGSFIWETKRILEEYSELNSMEELEDRVVSDNILNKSSETYRKNIIEKIKKRYLPEEDNLPETPLVKVMNSDLTDSRKDWILYYEFSKDDLVYELIVNFINVEYIKGSTYVKMEDVVDYIKQLEENHSEIENWSKKTVVRIAQHFLASLKNFGILEGSKKKKFKFISPPNEVIVYALYSLIDEGIERSEDIINHDDWKLFMMDEDQVRRSLGRLSPEFIRYEKRGSVEKIEPKYDSLEEVVDEF